MKPQPRWSARDPRSWLAGLALCTGACGSSSSPSVQSVGNADDPRFQQVLTALESDMEAHGVPGASIAIVENGTLTVAAGVGERRRGSGDPVTVSTRFRVASMSKMITAATALRLVEEGKLTLDAPITDAVPLGLASPFDPSTVTLAELLSHSAGIPDLGVGMSCPVGDDALSDWFAGDDDEPLWTPPGAVWNYSNRGFCVAGWAVAAAAGQPFEDAVATRVLGPAGMTTATYDPVAATAGDHATGVTSSSADVDPDAYDCGATHPADGIIATPTDYAHFAETLLAGGGTMLTPASVATLTTSHIDTDQLPGGNEGYGYGLFVRADYKGLRIWHHDGDDTGFRSEMWIAPDRGFAVIIFYNSQLRSPQHVAEDAVDIYLGLTSTAPAPVTTPMSEWTPYTGSYFDPYHLGTVTVTLAADGLHAALPQLGVDDVILTQSAGDAFSATLAGQSGTITFYPGAGGTSPAAWFVTRQGVGARVESSRGESSPPGCVLP